MLWGPVGVLLAFVIAGATALRYDPEQVGFNLNENQDALNPLDYWGQWDNHTYNPSPANWRFPFYTTFLDRFVNGDPTNDDANGTYFEHDIMGNQLRHGGDVQGFVDSLDYLQGMGIRAVYLAGPPMINTAWEYDGYSPLDFTLLDRHLGNIDLWRSAIDEIHSRGMYVVFDNTMATMGDLIGFDGYLNSTTPFTLKEHKVTWKSDRRYLDFNIGDNYNNSCHYPRFWNETGFPVGTDVTSGMVGCYDSDFDQYGDTEAFGVFPDWQRQLSKFASVQDRLREWVPSVRERIQHFSCITISMLDIDGFRFDKATQITVDAQGNFSDYIRGCARAVGKENFFLPGEITGGNTFGSIYLGRGREPTMSPDSIVDAVQMTNESDNKYFIRDHGQNALDAAAFHYTVYRSLTRFLGMDGNLASGYDAPINWVDAWNTMLLTNDMVNANTGEFDPRHMYGATNQDVFRWPAITNGTERMLLGLFITTLHMPGIPMLLWGEEQAFYVLDNTASNYIFGRQAMSPAVAWENHGCYALGSAQYYNFPVDSAKNGCKDETVSLDHRDPSSPVRNILKSMYQMRLHFPALNDGYFLQQLSNQTSNVYYPGSNGTPTETGMWSTMRGRFDEVQDFTGIGQGNQSVWLVYQNDNRTVNYQFDCSSNETALVSPFDEGTTVKNLFFPHDELTLKASSQKLGIDGSDKFNGCLDQLQLTAWEFRAYVPADQFVAPSPMITKFLPGHDARVQSKVAPGQQESIEIEIHFSANMDCDTITKTLLINSTTEDLRIAQLDSNSVQCQNVTAVDTPQFIGGIATAWIWKGNLTGVSNGVHAVTVKNATTDDGQGFTDSVDRFLFRVGQVDNPVVFPKTANYTRALLHQDTNGTLWVSHKAAGADMFRYSLNWGTTYSDWEAYHGGNTSLAPKVWSGTKLQDWSDEHVIMQYWNRLSGSSDFFQHADLGRESLPPRRFPHLFMHGPFNQYGFDAGVKDELELKDNGRWELNYMTEWPAVFQFNIWGMNPDGQPDQTGVLGDVDGDFVLDKMPPSSLSPTIVNVTGGPPSPYLAYRISLNDGNYKFELIPVGSRWKQMALYFLFWFVPVLTGALGIWAFMKSFYQVKFNEIGISDKKALIPLAIRRQFKRQPHTPGEEARGPFMRLGVRSGNASSSALASAAGASNRRTVLIATMEYDIEDWNIKIKIGGLGVMAQLMGKNLGHQDLIWVVPCVGGVDYPEDRRAEPMVVTVLGNPYEIKVQYHTLRNITYVLLDAPVFRQQTKAEPYPPRMDDLDSAIYYSAWNSCIAEAIKRFPIDLYHINDYHGAVAPIHLLPQTIPVCLSLHNAEFQGLWPMRTPKERLEVCQVYNLDPAIAQKYVQFGEVFNLLHAGASYLRVHQKGFGAVGVSKKYGKRSYARYPIFWGLKEVGQLPNPDPTDTGEWNKELPKEEDIKIDPEFEAGRADLKRQAQEWAHLEQNPKADLLVFVGRWSNQKGVDLIADVFPSVLEEHPHVQLICIGPVIDLYGKFAALKLDKMMKLYPGRVYSKPEFTALPPYIFSGAEFALIPSRDEPFGLVAVEFGRKGALGIGARVGGLGQMPGWWYTVESTTTTHLIHQFKQAIEAALASKPETRAMMRARSAKQRFPVAQWVEDLEILQSNAIRLHKQVASKSHTRPSSPHTTGFNPPSGYYTPSGYNTPSGAATPVGGHSRNVSGSRSISTIRPLSVWGKRNTNVYSGPSSPTGDVPPVPELKRTLSLGIRAGPGHVREAHKKRIKRHSGKGIPEDPTAVGMAVTDAEESDDEGYDPHAEEYTVTREQVEASRAMEQIASPALPALKDNFLPPLKEDFLSPRNVSFGHSPLSRSVSFRSQMEYSPDPSRPGTPVSAPSEAENPLLTPPMASFARGDNRFSNNSVLSLSSVVGGKKDFNLQKVDPFFTDSTGEYFKAFEKQLENLDGKTSEDKLCIEDYLVKSEKKWFDRFRDAKLGRQSAAPTPATSVFRMKRHASPPGSIFNEDLDDKASLSDQFLLGADYRPPTGMKKWLQIRIGDWPLYSFFLAFGQIIAANSYQITLLTGEVGQTAEKLYAIATVYLITSILWWFVFRSFKSIYVLSVPFIFYGLAFFFIGMAPLVHSTGGRGWVQNVATGLYATASSSGSIFFALNFGDEGGAPVKAWVYRACVIQGTQQIYVVALWYWGSTLTKMSDAGITESSTVTSSTTMTAACIPIAVLLWAVGAILFTGLPDYYRQAPGKVPSFYMSLFRRKIIGWFFITVLIQNYWLSAPYGRNWEYLWSSQHTKAWQIVLLIGLFFIGVWAAFLWLFGILSKDHSWILPVFAIGLGAPRWCQMLWSTSNIGQYVPWAGGHVASALVGRSLWLWLGVLDALQGVGFGMILLQTLTRIHIAFTLIAAQVLGSIATILARATAPNKIGPGGVFPDFSAEWGEGFREPWFWIALAFQLCICVGFFMFFRKEQLSKP
ncbi:MAG: Cell wall alpha-1,3-glucan synthase ags1 [Pycnora praestabilis]|nr:MAG: Cell wall alpha-1,3-glucan synthase ags1 [Pycnora praestabilis]